MIKAFIAGILGAIFIGVTSIIPGVNLFNMCCGAWFIIGGMVSAWLWTKLNDGRASFFYGLLSGVLAGAIFATCTLGVSAIGMAVQMDTAGKQLAALPQVKALPDRELTADEMVQLARKFVEENVTEEAERAKQLQKLKDIEEKIAAAKKDPEKSAQLQQAVDWINSFLAAVKKGDLSMLIGWVTGFLLMLGFIFMLLTAMGGFFGGLMFGSDAPPATPVQPGQPSATADTIPAS